MCTRGVWSGQTAIVRIVIVRRMLIGVGYSIQGMTSCLYATVNGSGNQLNDWNSLHLKRTDFLLQ